MTSNELGVTLMMEGDKRCFFKSIESDILTKGINLEAITSEGNRFPALSLDISTMNNPDKPVYSVGLFLSSGISRLHESYDEQKAREVYNACLNALKKGGKVKCIPSHMQIFDSDGKLVAKDLRY